MAAESGTGVPVACGAIGEFDPAAAARVAAGLEAEARQAHRDERSVLYLSSDGGRWSRAGDPDGGLAWSEGIPDRSATSSRWQEAARHGACGLAWAGEDRVLHASGTGLGSVYWMRVGGGVYFASEIAALAAAGLGGLSTDWQAWTEILALGYPLGERTPFAEIARLRPGAHLTVRANGGLEVSGGGLSWAEAPSLRPEDAVEQIVEALRSESAAIAADGPVACPLTGGWDSRMIACVLAERGLAECAYTTVVDHALDVDEPLGRPLADFLGIPHRVTDPELPPFASEVEQAAARVEYQTILHLPTNRLAAGMPRGGVCADGVAGDLLIKGLFTNEPTLAASDPLASIFDLYIPAKLDAVFPRGHWAALREPARAGFMQLALDYRGHESEVALSLWGVRTHRMIGSAPIRVIGQHRRLFMPLVSDGVARAAVGVDPREKLGGELYSKVLSAIAPGVEDLPSTRAKDAPEPSSPARQRSDEARRAQVEILARSPLRPWFSPRLERAVAGGHLDDLDTVARWLLRLQAIYLFTLWAERYRDLVGDPDPAAIFGSPGG